MDRTFASLVPTLLLAATGCKEHTPMPACDPLPEGAGALLVTGKTVLIGEVHGTAELHANVATLACHAAQRRVPVTVAFELPQSETPKIDAYLGSSGTPADRSALLAGEIWHRSSQDGLTSQAVFDAIELARRLRKAGAQVWVVGWDSDGDRDRNGAEFLARTLGQRPNDLLLAVGGMNHMWKDSRGGGAGFRLVQGGVQLTALKMSASGGTQWQCSGNKCIYDYPDVPTDQGPKPRVRLYGETRNGFDGELYVGKVHASMPAASPPAGGWPTM